MKKILLFLAFIPLFSFSQIINIPDPGFKASLITNSVDTNNNGDIELSEAQAVTTILYISNSSPNIYSLEGLQYFTNLKSLMLTVHATNADLTPLTALEDVTLSSCPNLTTLTVAGMPELKYIFIGDHCQQLESFSCAGLSNLLSFMVLGQTSMTTLDLTDSPLLQTFQAQGLTSIDISGLTNLTTIDCSSDFLTSLNVTGCTSLQVIDAWNSHIENFDVSGLVNLQEIDIQGANPSLGFPPTNLNASGCTGLTILDSMSGSLGTLNLTGCAALTSLQLDFNRLTDINLTGCTGLTSLHLSSNLLTTVDVTECTSLTALDVSGNPLQSLYIKNGIDEHASIINFPPIPFICADEADMPYLLNTQPIDPTQTLLTAYCTFVPGGNYNTITGAVRFDMGGEGCDTSTAMPLIKVGYDNGTDQYASFTNAQGNYTLYAHAGNYNPTAQMENSTYWNVSTTAPVSFADEDNHIEVRDFCITPNGSHPDVETVIMPMMPARPGFDATYYVTVRNKGNQTLSGNVVFNYNDNLTDFVSADPIAAIQSEGMLSWNYTSLQPFSTQHFFVTLNVNSPMETPAVNIDDVLAFTASATVELDETPDDNTSALNQIVVGSFDPNDKICIEGNVAPPSQIGEYLHYVINFENTGTFPAEKVVIKDLIDTTKFDMTSLQVLSASHAEIPVITGNTVEFYFQDIDLQPNQYGYVAFKIKTRPTLTVGSTVTNKANIYFDFNFPIETNLASTTFQELGIGGQEFDASVTVFPNPATAMVNVRSLSKIDKVAICDIQGRQLSQQIFDSENVAIDVSGLQNGIYFLTITTQRGIKTERLVKK